MNPKISADHLKRRAIVYVRQSSPGQVIHNQESQRRQYGLADHARQLGFQRVEITTRILDALDPARSNVLGSSISLRKSARERLAPYFASRLPAWPVTVETGIISSNSAAWCVPLSSIQTVSTIQASSMIGSCWGSKER